MSVVILIKPIDTKTKNGTPARVAGIGMIGGDLLDKRKRAARGSRRNRHPYSALQLVADRPRTRRLRMNACEISSKWRATFAFIGIDREL